MEDITIEPNIQLDIFEHEIIIKGQLVTISDYRVIKEAIKKIIEQGHRSISVTFIDTDSITSSVLGYFLKLVQKEKLDFKMNVKSNNLYNLLDMLSMIKVFNVNKI